MTRWYPRCQVCNRGSRKAQIHVSLVIEGSRAYPRIRCEEHFSTETLPKD